MASKSAWIVALVLSIGAAWNYRSEVVTLRAEAESLRADFQELEGKLGRVRAGISEAEDEAAAAKQSAQDVELAASFAPEVCQDFGFEVQALVSDVENDIERVEDVLSSAASAAR